MAASASRTACRSLLRQQRPFTHSARSASSSSSSSSASSSSPSTWQPLLKPGVLPAYDEALSFLSSHSSSLRQRISALETDQTLSESDRTDLKESLEIASLINDPLTLSSFQSSSATHYDATNPAFRYLRERLWRKDSGVLAKLMERCTLMHVLPDVLPSITPTADVQVAFGEGAGFTDHSSQGGDVLAGAFVEPKLTLEAPRVDVNVFHTDEKKYTLAIVDPDQPEEEGYRTTLLALKQGITLSATRPQVDLTTDMTVHWIPPHPAQGTKYHRYTTVLFSEPDSAHEEAPVDRENFDIRAYARHRGLTPTGIHFWRAKWSHDSKDAISAIYTDILKTQEPKFTKPPSLDKVRKQVGDLGSKWFS